MDLDKSINSTIKRAHNFGNNLCLVELEQRLEGNRIWTKDEIEKAAAKIKLSREKGNDYWREKVKKAKLLVANYLGEIEDILLVGITGSVASHYPKKDDDIDLLIVTKRNQLWWTRLKLRWLIWAKGVPHRKYGQKEKKDEFCFNLWLEEDSLEIPQSRQNRKNALDLVMMITVLNREKTYEKFIEVNSWAKNYVATGYSNLKSRIQNLKSQGEKIKNRKSRMENTLAYWLQRGYTKLRGRKTGLVDKKRAFFHD